MKKENKKITFSVKGNLSSFVGRRKVVGREEIKGEEDRAATQEALRLRARKAMENS